MRAELPTGGSQEFYCFIESVDRKTAVRVLRATYSELQLTQVKSFFFCDGIPGLEADNF